MGESRSGYGIESRVAALPFPAIRNTAQFLEYVGRRKGRVHQNGKTAMRFYLKSAPRLGSAGLGTSDHNFAVLHRERGTEFRGHGLHLFHQCNAFFVT